MQQDFKGAGIDLAFFCKSIEEYKKNPREISKLYKSLRKELFDNQEIFEYIQYQIKVFNRVPEFVEIQEKFGIDISLINTSYSTEYFVSLIKDRYLRRGLVRFAKSVAEEKDISSINIDDLYKPIIRLSEEYREITDIENAFVKSISELVDEAKAIVDEAVTGNNSRLIKSPWPTFQKSTGGVAPGEFTIIAGRPGTGKTWMLYKWAYSVASDGKRVLLFNTEMSGSATLLRLACLNTGLRVSSIRNRTITIQDADVLKREIDRIRDLKNLIITDVGFSPTLMNIIKEIKNHSPDIVFIDSAYLIRASEYGNLSRTENASEVSDSLKNAAISLNIPIVCAIQHNREAVRGVPSLATLSLTDSNAWNASFVLSIDPPVSKGTPSPVSETWRVHIIKNREGDLATFNISKETYEETQSEEYSVFGVKVRL
ncbi:MAG: DnaB-like helicase C-terminal domain-containing protein [Nitrososphaerota archaeon]